MEERRKDFVEDTSVAVIEAAVSMIPIVGGPAAVIINRSFGSAVQRRNERIFAEIATDVELLMQRVDVIEPGQSWPLRNSRQQCTVPSGQRRKLPATTNESFFETRS